MLLIVSDNLRSHASVNDVAREMSMTLSYFGSPKSLADFMPGKSRRIVLLTEDEVVAETVQALAGANDQASFAVIVAANRSALRGASRAKAFDELTDFENVEWIGSEFDFDALSTSARRCRRRMLRISRDELEEALEQDQFVLRYQPKVERSAGSDWVTREAEALIRWQHPTNGLLGPLEFLPEVEAFGLMKDLSEFVLREAASQLVAWRSRGLYLKSCINLASSQLIDLELADTYAAIVRQAGLECSLFTFEIVEQELSDQDAPHLQVLNALRDNGFRICLDDFRVAASSLSTFEQLPFDEIKIHASALRRAQNDPVSMTVLAAVTGLAHNLGMSVCAEGVEEQDTFDFLKTIECDKMQGFLISEAVVPSIIRRVYSADEESANSAA